MDTSGDKRRAVDLRQMRQEAVHYRSERKRVPAVRCWSGVRRRKIPARQPRRFRLEQLRRRRVSDRNVPARIRSYSVTRNT